VLEKASSFLLRLVPLRNSLLARAFVGEHGEARGVARARGAICGRLLQRHRVR
jgi:hypothetical protein